MKLKKPLIGPAGIVVIILLAGIWYIVSGVIGLQKQAQPLNDVFSSREKGVRYAGTPFLGTNSYSHVIDTVLILPIGNEYYYVLYSEDVRSALCVRSLKKLNSIEDLGTIDGVLKRLDTENERDFKAVKSQINMEPLHFISEYYLDTAAKQLYIERILLGVCILTAIGSLAYFIRLGKNSWSEYTNGERVLNLAGCAVMLAGLWLFLRCLML